jgi:hypothetical protein
MGPALYEGNDVVGSQILQDLCATDFGKNQGLAKKAAVYTPNLKSNRFPRASPRIRVR